MCWYRNKNHKTQKPQNKDLLLITTLTQQYLRLYLLLIKQCLLKFFFLKRLSVHQLLCTQYFCPQIYYNLSWGLRYLFFDNKCAPFVTIYMACRIVCIKVRFAIAANSTKERSDDDETPPKTSRILRDISLEGQKMPKGSIIHWERARMARGQED